MTNISYAPYGLKKSVGFLGEIIPFIIIKSLAIVISVISIIFSTMVLVLRHQHGHGESHGPVGEGEEKGS